MTEPTTSDYLAAGWKTEIVHVPGGGPFPKPFDMYVWHKPNGDMWGYNWHLDEPRVSPSRDAPIPSEPERCPTCEGTGQVDMASPIVPACGLEGNADAV